MVGCGRRRRWRPFNMLPAACHAMLLPCCCLRSQGQSCLMPWSASRLARGHLDQHAPCAQGRGAAHLHHLHLMQQPRDLLAQVLDLQGGRGPDGSERVQPGGQGGATCDLWGLARRAPVSASSRAAQRGPTGPPMCAAAAPTASSAPHLLLKLAPLAVAPPPVCLHLRRCPLEAPLLGGQRLQGGGHVGVRGLHALVLGLTAGSGDAAARRAR